MNNEKKTYTTPDVQVFQFNQDDVIISSNTTEIITPDGFPVGPDGTPIAPDQNGNFPEQP